MTYLQGPVAYSRESCPLWPNPAHQMMEILRTHFYPEKNNGTQTDDTKVDQTVIIIACNTALPYTAYR